jgi:hypothetical protein
MKKQLYLTILLLIPIFNFSQSLDKKELRNYSLQSIQRKSALDTFASIINRNTLTTYEECYLGICTGLQIQYVSSMWGKYKMLDRSRDDINNSVKRDPQSADLRFIRFMLEQNIPSFLGMSTHIRQDLSFVFSHLDFVEDAPDLTKMAMEFILSSNRCNTEEKKILERTVYDLKQKMYASR